MPQSSEMIGKVVGNYEITSELSHGGMGTVYRGRHLTLPREVVIKSILRVHFSQPELEAMFKKRFRREAHIQSQLDHLNIVRVYDYFDSLPENYYLVMEYVAGMDLQALLQRQGALPPAQATGFIKQALAAMDYAHNFSYVDEVGQRHTGLIHRDIKPANMLLDGQLRYLKVTDFGIVKAAGEQNLTRSGSMVGTLPYMSPEQVRGRELDVRSDLYSLGVMLYYMLACRLPFLLPETDSEYELSKAKVELAPLPLITLRPETPAGLAEIVMYSIRNDPAERFQTAADFLDAILEYEKEAGSSRKASTGTQATLSPPDALVDPSVSTMPQAARPPIVVPLGPPENSQLVAPVSAISEEARPQPGNRRWLIAGAMLFLMILAGASALFLARKGNGGIDVNKDLSHLLRQIYADGIKTADEQAALDRMAREYSLDVLRIAQQEQEIKDRLSQAEKGLKQGMAYASQQNYEQAAKEFKRSVEIDPEYAPAWANLCSAHLSLNREQEAQAACEQALAVDAKNWLARYNLGSLYARKGDRDRAFRELAETLRLVSEDTSQRVTRAEILNHIKTDPMLSSLRNDARFAQLSGQR